MFNSLWYHSLTKPFLMPPSWLFAPVWTVIYVLIALSLVFYITTYSQKTKVFGYLYFAVQMALNFLWSPVFFYFRGLKLALIIILLMDIFVILNIFEFRKISKLAGNLLIPYFIWILFATYLTAAINLLN